MGAPFLNASSKNYVPTTLLPYVCCLVVHKPMFMPVHQTDKGQTTQYRANHVAMYMPVH